MKIDSTLMAVAPCAIACALFACGVDGTPPIGDGIHEQGNGNDAGGATHAGDAGGGGSANDAGVAIDSGGGGAVDSGGGGNDAGTPCYSEVYHPNANLADLKSAYTSSGWLAASLETMKRRYDTGHFVLDGEKTDPQLNGFVDSSSWSALMESLMTMVHEESHGYDFDHSQVGSHLYVLRDDLQVTPPELPNMWTRSEIKPLLPDNSTSGYDNVYLTGTQGTYDVVFLAEELNAYINGLAAITAVASEITSGISARDGVAAHLLYLELYLRRGRTAHPQQYAALKADANWQKFVRYEWARAFFWDAQAKPFPLLDIATAPIMAHVNEAANKDEIKQFTGDDADFVACHP